MAPNWVTCSWIVPALVMLAGACFVGNAPAAAFAPVPPDAAPANPVIQIVTAHVEGNADAPVTLVEFSDYQCPFCGRHARETWPRLEKEYVAPGKLRYVFRNFPIESMHPNAFKAAEAAECAGDQGRFWALHDRLFGHQANLTQAGLVAHARTVGLNHTAFQECLDGAKYAPKVRRDLADGRAAGVTGTPTFFIGKTTPGVTLHASQMLKGAKTYAVFKSAIDDLLTGR